MIRVENISKRFGNHLAVDNLSFHVSRGEILGFLGPNGAGKTTTMRMLTCYLPASSGTATINGLDIFKQSLELRRIIGYLPESAPLYDDMRVREYLRFKAGIQQVPSNKITQRISYVLERCRIADVSDRIIGQLSKGYRQRVGLAAALVHDPLVLILDEPTIGLDPNQIRETRAMIKELGKEHTILLSTHILPEVEAVCQRVVILDKGRLVAMDTPENLIAKMQGGVEIVAEIRGPVEKIVASLRDLVGVLGVEQESKGDFVALTIQTQPGTDLREEVAKCIVHAGGTLRELRAVRRSLEDIFVKITTTENKETQGAEARESLQTAAVS